jgi:hypothetical protein
VAIEFITGAEETHKIGETGAKRIRRWLDSTYRFRIDQTIYDLDQNGNPYPKLRVPQLAWASDHPRAGEARFERFDLVGSVLNEAGAPGNRLYVECKNYAGAGNQGVLYDEYLAVCYSAFVAFSTSVGAPFDIEFMWATTHPFAQTSYTALVTAAQIASACETHRERLGEHAFDPTIAQQLESRLWLAIVNIRVDEMIMGLELQKAVIARILELAG